MKKILTNIVSAFGLILLISSCSKNEDTFDAATRFEEEKGIIATYAKSKYPNMNISSDTTGIWFEVINPGEEGSYEYKVIDTVYNGYNTKMVRPADITVRYTGKLISNETVFDSNTSEAGMSGKTTDYISAWYYAFMPKSIGEHKIGGLTLKGLQKGSKIRIITPSYFAYGNSSVGTIPANSPLYFEIEVVSIKDHNPNK
ncbi:MULTISPECIES: FKBP-type peptidyl-prolyl cis-trans isomerase [Sphingobacterium]|uniref:FKBP-type peptidyl-prolyl cis-trans isomerase n=1 Tax=Sphingobacterium TaxID=28453 RepID=UPI0013DAC10A|nr:MULTISPECIES: FKBP-type peptidyl-prolyl cis-trans isomerase [unclassified Sphingobacterium]